MTTGQPTVTYVEATAKRQGQWVVKFPGENGVRLTLWDDGRCKLGRKGARIVDVEGPRNFGPSQDGKQGPDCHVVVTFEDRLV